MITSDQQAREVQARYAKTHVGLAPAVCRYLRRQQGRDDSYAHMAERELGFVIGKERVIPKKPERSIPSTVKELVTVLGRVS